jgi:formate hydrogenlyase subunit 3/multisubunit Na+/H+ antiporter MnhD subunit
MIAGSLLLISLPLLVAPVIWLLRRWATIATFLSAGISLGLAFMSWRLPLDQPTHLWGRQIVLGETVSVLGRDVVMTRPDQLGLAFIFFTAALLFLLAWQTSQGWTFYPLGMALLGVLSGALLVESHIYAALFLQIAAALCVFLIQGGQIGSTRGALRFLTYMTLAIPPILLTSWFLGRFEWTPDETALLDISITLFAFGFAIMMGVVPFHIWVTAVSTDAPPLVSTFILGIFYAVVWFILLNLIESFEWLAAHPNFRLALSYSGYTMVGLGAFMAPAQRGLGRLMGYAALADMGTTQIALGLGNMPGLNAALLTLVMRAVSLAVMGTGISILRHRAEGDNFDRLIGWGRHVPWATMALVIGGLSLAGLPPGAGFGARWSITNLVAHQPSNLGNGISGAAGATFLLLSSVAVGIGVLRALLALLQEPKRGYVGSEIVMAIEAAARPPKAEPKPPEHESRLLTCLIIASLIFCLLLGLAPQLPMEIIKPVASSYTFLNAITLP